jgi:hypothetical protein
VTAPMLPELRGAALVGRRVEVWWAADRAFNAATVTGYNDRARATGYVRAAACRPRPSRTR